MGNILLFTPFPLQNKFNKKKRIKSTKDENKRLHIG